MKKAYNKPFIMVELFQLDAAMAASCTSEKKAPLNHTINDCWSSDLPGSDAGYWTSGSCNHDPAVEGDGNDYICYHGPTIDIATLYMNS